MTNTWNKGDIAMIAVCSLVCGFEVTQMTLKYLKFEVVTEVIFQYPETVTVPDIVFCIPFGTINEKVLKETFPLS